MENNIIVPNGSTGAVQIEQARVMAEVLAATQAAKLYPRNEELCKQKILTVCGNLYFAEKALYKIQMGSSTTEGLSIRAAEQFAAYWGNIDYGAKQLQSDGDSTEFYIYCHDLENNIRSGTTVTFSHYKKKIDRNTKQELITQITDPKLLQDHLKAKTAIVQRERILSVIPQYIIREAIGVIYKTREIDTNNINIKKIIDSFKAIDVNKKTILSFLDIYNENDIKGINVEKYRELQTIYITLKEDDSAKPEHFFEIKHDVTELPPPPKKIIE